MQVTENRCPGMLISCSKSVNTPGDLHSSFVVFYFVFVFRLPPDVNHGATAFLHFLAPAEHSGEELLDFFNILLLLENSKERRAAARH